MATVTEGLARWALRRGGAGLPEGILWVRESGASEVLKYVFVMRLGVVGGVGVGAGGAIAGVSGGGGDGGLDVDVE